jgi:hypothetical protein
MSSISSSSVFLDQASGRCLATDLRSATTKNFKKSIHKNENQNQTLKESSIFQLLQIFITAHPHQGVSALAWRPQAIQHFLPERRHRRLNGWRVGPARMHSRKIDFRVVARKVVGHDHLLALLLRIHGRAIKLRHLLVHEIIGVELMRQHTTAAHSKLKLKKIENFKIVIKFLLINKIK